MEEKYLAIAVISIVAIVGILGAVSMTGYFGNFKMIQEEQLTASGLSGIALDEPEQLAKEAHRTYGIGDQVSTYTKLLIARQLALKELKAANIGREVLIVDGFQEVLRADGKLRLAYGGLVFINKQLDQAATARLGAILNERLGKELANGLVILPSDMKELEAFIVMPEGRMQGLGLISSTPSGQPLISSEQMGILAVAHSGTMQSLDIAHGIVATIQREGLDPLKYDIRFVQAGMIELNPLADGAKLKPKAVQIIGVLVYDRMAEAFDAGKAGQLVGRLALEDQDNIYVAASGESLLDMQEVCKPLDAGNHAGVLAAFTTEIGRVAAAYPSVGPFGGGGTGGEGAY